MNVPGYSYEQFCAGIAERDRKDGVGGCFVRRVLIERRRAQIAEWAGSHGTVDSRAEWIPASLLRCDGQLDGHHLLPKSWLKGEFPGGSWALYPVGDGFIQEVVIEGSDWHWPLPSMLNDSRNGICVCRRHHDFLENARVKLNRGDLPPTVEEFAAELGGKAVARLERQFGLAPSVVSESEGAG